MKKPKHPVRKKAAPRPERMLRDKDGQPRYSTRPPYLTLYKSLDVFERQMKAWVEKEEQKDKDYDAAILIYIDELTEYNKKLDNLATLSSYKKGDGSKLGKEKLEKLNDLKKHKPVAREKRTNRAKR